jgi:hypothetical protein
MAGKKSNKYYWYGILTIIPIFGLIIGILLFRKGVILRNRLLLFIGGFGIFFTLAFFVGGLFFSKYSDLGKRKRVELARISLNRVMQDIEYYKIQFGNYPDSLEELKIVDNMVFIMDPLSQKGVFSRNLNYLQYKKIDSSHYTVYSAGYDRIPNTVDDVYPLASKLIMSGLVKDLTYKRH